MPRLGDETASGWEQCREIVFDQYPESLVDRHDWQPGVACLLQSFDEQWTIAGLGKHMGIEVVTFNTLGVGQDDLAHPERRKLSPQPPQNLRTRQREKQINWRPRGNFGLKDTVKREALIAYRRHDASANRAVDQPDPDHVAGHSLQHIFRMTGPCAGQSGCI